MKSRFVALGLGDNMNELWCTSDGYTEVLLATSSPASDDACAIASVSLALSFGHEVMVRIVG